MLLLIEGYKTTRLNELVKGKEEDRIILYHKEQIETLLAYDTYSVYHLIDLLTSNGMRLNKFQLEHFSKIGVHLS